jgi:hypothetical protein
MVISAHSFLLGARRCAENRPTSADKFEMLIMPQVAMVAFAIELYLKAILIKLRLKATYTHDLFELYRLLPPNSQLELWIGSGHAKDEFEELLKLSADAFEEFRYMYEFDSIHISPGFLFSLAETAKRHFEQIS